MKLVNINTEKNKQAVLSLVETTKFKEVAGVGVNPAVNGKKSTLRSDYELAQKLQMPHRHQEQAKRNIDSFAFSQSDHVDDSLWLCIYFPKLSIDIAATEEYRVIYQENKGQCVVYKTSEVVSKNGVSPGMSLDAARILCPELKALRRDEKAEDQYMQKLADWAYRYSSDLSVINSNTLVLEVGSSTCLYKGLKTLCDLMAAQLLLEWKIDYRMAVSPTPLASMTLAQQNDDKDDIPIIMQKQALRSELGGLSIEALLVDEQKSVPVLKKTKSTAFSIKDIKSFHSMGVSTLSDLWRLPSEGLLVRFGVEALAYLERLLGKQADPVKCYTPALRFDSELELPLETKNNKLVLQALSMLLDELVAYLITQDAGTDTIEIILSHAASQHLPTSLNIYLREYIRDKKHIFMLLEERFNRVSLLAPVIGVCLRTNSIEAYSASPEDLFEYDIKQTSSNKNSNAWKVLLEQFNARLGENRITSIGSVADHRPERAWRYQQKNEHREYSNKDLLRPTGIFPEAVRLVSYQKQLELLHGPERIENGWWDGDDIRRDYYIARDQSGARLWVYCDLKHKDRWYIHGLFG